MQGNMLLLPDYGQQIVSLLGTDDHASDTIMSTSDGQKPMHRAKILVHVLSLGDCSRKIACNKQILRPCPTSVNT